MSHNSCGTKFYGLMRPRLTSKKVMERPKVWRKKGSAHDPKHTSTSVKHGGVTWVRMAASGVGSLIFVDNVTHGGSSRINSEVYKNILSANLRKNSAHNNWEELHHAASISQNTAKDFIWEKKWKVLNWTSQSPDHNTFEHAFHLLKGKPPETNNNWRIVWWCQWAGFMQLLQARDMLPNIVAYLMIKCFTSQLTLIYLDTL